MLELAAMSSCNSEHLHEVMEHQACQLVDYVYGDVFASLEEIRFRLCVGDSESATKLVDKLLGKKKEIYGR